MRIGYNCRFLGGPLTGVQRIAQDLFNALVEIDRDNEYVAFLCGRGGRHIAALDRPNVTLVGGETPVTGRFRRQAWEQDTLPRLVVRADLDVMHHPANTAPRRGLGRACVSIYDTSFLAHPEWFNRRFRWYYRWLIPRVARGAARIITCSEFSKREIVDRLHAGPGRVDVVYPGVSPVFLASAEKGTGSLFRDDASHRPDPPFILFVGGTNPRKNLATLAAAMPLLRDRPGLADVTLKVVGAQPGIFAKRGTDPVSSKGLAEKGSDPVSSRGLTPFSPREHAGDSGIHYLGDVDETALVSLYRRAACMCYPSLYEGFGLPPLEALAVGTPVVAADIPVLREVLADAALFAPPTDPAALADALAGVLTDDALRARLIALGADRVPRFTYPAAARRTLEIYEAVVRNT